VFGYDPTEFAASLRSIADGEVDVAPMITGEVGLQAVGEAFDDPSDPDRRWKILVLPNL
jgi:threonine dehydrogenase-like Zn-dependent dehydrogenase